MNQDPSELPADARPEAPDGLNGPGPFAHLARRPGGPGQSQAWAKREADRRAGRRRKEWWKSPPPPMA